MSDNTPILKTLTAMAERLSLSSNQALLLFAGAHGWLNMEMTVASVTVLHQLAKDHDVDLYEEEPFLAQLIARGVFTPEECVLFGWSRVKKEALHDGQ